MAITDRSLQPVLEKIDALIESIRVVRVQERDRTRQTRTLNFLVAIRAALVAYCEPNAPDDYYYYEFTK